MKYIPLLLATVLNASANLLMKSSTRALPEGRDGLWVMLTRPSLWAGLVCFGLSLVGYSLALRSFAITVAYPVMVGLGFAIVTTVAYFVFAEPLSFTRILGICLIFLGVFLATR
jgi:undecaprenyl phosphate-alpha-L-ara4N flippase subunit ArnE